MARIKIDLPEHFSFSCRVPVRITDINYGGHVGNDTLLTIIHEARMQFFKKLGYTELNFAGSGMIMADAAIEFKSELFYGDELTVAVTAGDLTKIGFDLFYRLEKPGDQEGDKHILVAVAKTGMLCYDYSLRKIVAVPVEAKLKLEAS
jgi:acyl-CoA thioesterase FadM